MGRALLMKNVAWVMVLVVAAIVEADTPPGIANNPSHARCLIKKYKMCYNLEHVCPKFCPDSCTVECVSCKPICSGGSTPPPEEDNPPDHGSGGDGKSPSPPEGDHGGKGAPPPENDNEPPSKGDGGKGSAPPKNDKGDGKSPPPQEGDHGGKGAPPPKNDKGDGKGAPPPKDDKGDGKSQPPSKGDHGGKGAPPPDNDDGKSPPPPKSDGAPPPKNDRDDGKSPPPKSDKGDGKSPPPPEGDHGKGAPLPPPHVDPITPSPPPPPYSPPPPTTPSLPPSTSPITPPPSTPPTTPSTQPPTPLPTPSPAPPTTSTPPPPIVPVTPPPSGSLPPPAPYTPPSPGDSSDAAAGRRKRCKNKNYPQCYGVQHVCPTSCPHTCEVDCVTCKPVCKCDMPGAVCQDPRFIGGDGITFYFHGKKDKDFCLVTEPNFQINAHFIGKRNHNMNRDFTWVQSIAILFGDHQLFVGAQKTATWNDAVDRFSLAFDGEPILLSQSTWRSAGTTISRDSDTNSVIIEIDGLLKISAKVVPITQHESRVHNYAIAEDDCFAHLELGFKFFSLSGNVNGVLGQTYGDKYVSRVKMGVPVPVLGGETEFAVSNIFAPDCSVSQFRAGRLVPQNYHVSSFEIPSMKCGSGMGGTGGVVCKK